MAIRQQDIAAHLGISTYTVSLALRNIPKVAETTRRQVLEAAEQLGYFQRLRVGLHVEIERIAFVTTFESKDLFYANVLNGAADECQQHGISLHYLPFPKTLHQHAAPHIMSTQYSDSDAMLVVGPIDEPTVHQLSALGRPLVLVDNTIVHLPIDRVLIENVMSTRRTVGHLVDAGHRQIAFINGPETTTSFRERLLGYKTAIAEHGLETYELYSDSAAIAPAEAAIGRWIDTHGTPPFTAIIACNDEVAIGTIHALEARGIQVPKHLSIVGFDDIDMAKSMRPALTTVHVDRELLGQLGVRLLIERAQHPDARSRAIMIDTSYIERASVLPTKKPTRS